MDTVQTLGSRIRQKRKELNLSQAQLAQKMSNTTHSSVSQWEKNQSKPNVDNLYELSVIFNCDIPWLLKGLSNYTNVAPAHPNHSGNFVPILSAKEIIQCHIASSVPTSGKDEVIMIEFSPFNCFGYKITDESMEPEFFIDDLIVIDMSLRPAPGEFVLARIDNSDNLVFRKFHIESIQVADFPVFRLVPLAEEYPSLSSKDHQIDIIGVMVEHRIYRRKRK